MSVTFGDAFEGELRGFTPSDRASSPPPRTGVTARPHLGTSLFKPGTPGRNLSPTNAARELEGAEDEPHGEHVLAPGVVAMYPAPRKRYLARSHRGEGEGGE